jgi:ribosomal protein L23
MNRKGKVTQTRLGSGRRPDQKRAVVKLRAGDTIEIFEARGP